MGLFSNSGTVNVGPQLKQVATSAQDLYNKGAGFKPPPMSDLYTPFSQQTQGALSGMMGVARQGNPLAGQSIGAVSGILDPNGAMNKQYQDLYNNSGNAAFAGAVQNQSDQLANDVQRQFSGLGRLGSAADTGALTTQLGNFRSNMASQNWNQNVANQRGILGDQMQGQLGAVAAAPGAYDQQYAPYRMQAQVGNALDQQAQAKAAANLTRFNAQNNGGWSRLGAYSGILNGNTQAAQNAGLVQPPSNPLGGILGGGLAGGQIGNMIPGLGGGWGAGIGAGLGYLANQYQNH